MELKEGDCLLCCENKAILSNKQSFLNLLNIHYFKENQTEFTKFVNISTTKNNGLCTLCAYKIQSYDQCKSHQIKESSNKCVICQKSEFILKYSLISVKRCDANLLEKIKKKFCILCLQCCFSIEGWQNIKDSVSKLMDEFKNDSPAGNNNIQSKVIKKRQSSETLNTPVNNKRMKREQSAEKSVSKFDKDVQKLLSADGKTNRRNMKVTRKMSKISYVPVTRSERTRQNSKSNDVGNSTQAKVPKLKLKPFAISKKSIPIKKSYSCSICSKSIKKKIFLILHELEHETSYSPVVLLKQLNLEKEKPTVEKDEENVSSDTEEMHSNAEEIQDDSLKEEEIAKIEKTSSDNEEQTISKKEEIEDGAVDSNIEKSQNGNEITKEESLEENVPNEGESKINQVNNLKEENIALATTDEQKHEQEENRENTEVLENNKNEDTEKCDDSSEEIKKKDSDSEKENITEEVEENGNKEAKESVDSLEVSKNEEVEKSDDSVKVVENGEVEKSDDSEKGEVEKSDDAEKGEIEKSDDSEKGEVEKSDDSEKGEVEKSDDSEKGEIEKSDDSEKGEIEKSDDSEKVAENGEADKTDYSVEVSENGDSEVTIELKNHENGESEKIVSRPVTENEDQKIVDNLSDISDKSFKNSDDKVEEMDRNNCEDITGIVIEEESLKFGDSTTSAEQLTAVCKATLPVDSYPSVENLLQDLGA